MRICPAQAVAASGVRALATRNALGGNECRMDVLACATLRAVRAEPMDALNVFSYAAASGLLVVALH